MKIPSFKYYFDKKALKNISKRNKDILKNNKFLSEGSLCKEFETSFLNYHNAKYGTTCSSGTTALELIFHALDLQNEEVLFPTNTFTATIISGIRANVKPILYDSDMTLNWDLESIKRKISPNTKAICIVHIGGFINPDIFKLQKLCKEKNLLLIEDCAHAHGSYYKGKYAGTFGDMAAFSFYSTKVMSAGEGGFVFCKNKSLLNLVNLYKNQGQLKDNLVTVKGFNGRMSEFSANLLIEQMRQLNSMIILRNQVAEQYDLFFKDIKIQDPTPDHIMNYYKYLIKINPNNLKNIYKKFKDKNISLGGQVYPISCHQQKALEEFSQEKFTNAEFLNISHIALPIYPQMKKKELDYIIKNTKEILKI